jgi:hypothetical protein
MVVVGRGETYTSNGRTRMYALGLRGAGTAQRNELTPAQNLIKGFPLNVTHIPIR